MKYAFYITLLMGTVLSSNAFSGTTYNINVVGDGIHWREGAFYKSQGDIILSPESIKQMGDFPFYDSTSNIYCTATPSECDAALAALGVNKITLAAKTTTKQNLDGSYTIYNADGAIKSYKGKRIYTVFWRYFPIQKEPKILSRISFVSICPVILPSAREARRMSSAESSISLSKLKFSRFSRHTLKASR